MAPCALTWRVESLICHLTQYIEYDCQSDERAPRVVGALHGAFFLALFVNVAPFGHSS